MRDVGEAAEPGNAATPTAQAEEAVHLAGSAVVTGGVAAMLLLVAVPVSIGLGVLWGVQSLGKRLRGTGE
ncbi:MAG: hypothetical protein JJE34_09085 [Alphaproteobacteria bacterium]|nr:hypothetical protein [Alphaproteobacteria bacterium]